jgi:pimeloyl-ACP methyl ester carboxylesterase
MGDRLENVLLPLGLPGTLCVPGNSRGLVAFAHGSGSSRFSPRNTAVATALNDRGFATLLFDLLTPQEEQDRSNVFDVPLLGGRLVEAVAWLGFRPETAELPIGLFGASTGAAAALVAAASLPGRIAAVVSRGGRPDLAGKALALVRAPTLLIVGGADFGVIELNEEALARLPGPKALTLVPGATHLFPEPGAMETVIELAVGWFERYLGPETPDAQATDAVDDLPSQDPSMLAR